MNKALRALALSVALALGVAASTARPAVADAPIPASYHLTWADCTVKGDAGLNLAYAGYYCTTDWIDPKLIVLMVYYPE